MQSELSGQVRPFQKCGACGFVWNGWRDFILDPRTRVLGLQAIPEMPEVNLLVFEHGCGSSVSIRAARLRHLAPELGAEKEWPVLYGSETCRQLCRSIENLEICDRPCANARDRRLIRLVLEMKRGI